METLPGCQSIPCAFCRGRKVDPYNQLSSRSRCEVCKGKGRVMVPVLRDPCAYCRGTGSVKTFACLVCRGTGVVPSLPGPTKVCPCCEGRAFEISSGLACLECEGRGKVSARPVRRRRP
jgi:DnaJ-class molecular chaperone